VANSGPFKSKPRMENLLAKGMSSDTNAQALELNMSTPPIMDGDIEQKSDEDPYAQRDIRQKDVTPHDIVDQSKLAAPLSDILRQSGGTVGGTHPSIR
jgi:hypothetical protein